MFGLRMFCGKPAQRPSFLSLSSLSLIQHQSNTISIHSFCNCICCTPMHEDPISFTFTSTLLWMVVHCLRHILIHSIILLLFSTNSISNHKSFSITFFNSFSSNFSFFFSSSFTLYFMLRLLCDSCMLSVCVA